MNRKANSRKLVSEAEQALNKGHVDKAALLFRRAITADPNNGDAFMGMAAAEIQVNNLVQAEWALVGAMDLIQDKDRLSKCKTMLGDVYLAERPVKAKHLDAIAKMADELIKTNPNSADGHRQLAEVARLKGIDYETGEPQQAKIWREKALAEYRLADSLHPRDARVLTGWAETSAAVGDFQQAETLYRQYISINPVDTRPHLGLADVAGARKDPAAAAAAIQGALAQKQPDKQALIEFCYRSFTKGRPADALPIVTWLASNGGDPVAVAQMFISCEQTDIAKRHLELAIAKHDDADRSIAYTRLGELLVTQGLHERAQSVATECLKTYPKQTGCQAIQLYENVKLGGGEEAEKKLELLVSENPGERLAHLYLGSVRQTAGRMEEARVQFSLGLRAYPHDESLLLARARLEAVLNELPLARADVLEVLKSEPADKAAQAVLRQIDDRGPGGRGPQMALKGVTTQAFQ